MDETVTADNCRPPPISGQEGSSDNSGATENQNDSGKNDSLVNGNSGTTDNPDSHEETDSRENSDSSGNTGSHRDNDGHSDNSGESHEHNDSGNTDQPGHTDPPADPPQPRYVKDENTIRIMAANITASTNGSYNGPGIRIFMGLKPDIVLIQEFLYLPELDDEFKFADLDEFVAKTFGSGFVYHRGVESWLKTKPNGIISRYPIIASGSWDDSKIDDRDFEWARLDIPGEKDLLVVSVHMATGADKRGAEGAELANYIKENIAGDYYLAIGGDFNTQSRSEDVFTSLSDIVVIDKNHYPTDQQNNGNTNYKRNYPYDGVYVDTALQALEVPVALGSTQKAGGLVFDSRKFTPLSDVAPVLIGDSKNTNMQHMAVVRDFAVAK